jgi:hypothetical protein
MENKSLCAEYKAKARSRSNMAGYAQAMEGESEGQSLLVQESWRAVLNNNKAKAQSRKSKLGWTRWIDSGIGRKRPDSKIEWPSCRVDWTDC